MAFHWAWSVVLAGCVLLVTPADARDRNVRAEFQRMNPCPSTGHKRGPCPGWIVDHVIALACGGSDAIENMQWQTIAEAKVKDRWERKNCGR